MGKRERILARLHDILLEVADAPNVGRNVTDVSDSNRPALILLDGDQAADPRIIGRGRPINSANLVTMRPEVVILAGSGSGDENIGTVLNSLHDQIFVKVMSDNAGWQNSIAADLAVYYEGCASDLGRGREMEGAMVAQFRFDYYLDPQNP